eukprot:scaffold2115_cov108-Skeletonema_menzelii.AAC.4
MKRNENTKSEVVEPSVHDVLSGIGAWLNRHPGNAHFRRMIEEQKAAYVAVAGNKNKQRNISRSIVAAIHSKEPPGRFLKKCPETGKWTELSTKEAEAKVAQAMVYAVRGESLKQSRGKRRRHSQSRSLPSWTLPSSSSQPRDDEGTIASSQATDKQTNNQLEAETGTVTSAMAMDHPEVALPVRGSVRTTNTEQPTLSDGRTGLALTANDRPFPGALNLQQQQLPHSTSNALTVTLGLGAPLDADQRGMAQVLAQAYQQQQLHDLKQQQQENAFGQATQQQLPPAPTLLSYAFALYPPTFTALPVPPNCIPTLSPSYYAVGYQPQSLFTSNISQNAAQPQPQNTTNDAQLLGILTNVYLINQEQSSLAYQLSLIASNQMLLLHLQQQQQLQQQQYQHDNYQQQQQQQQASQQQQGYLPVNPLNQTLRQTTPAPPPLRQNQNLPTNPPNDTAPDNG